MTTTGLTVSYFNPIISKKEPQFFGPGHRSFEIGKEGSLTRFTHDLPPGIEISSVGPAP